MKSPRKKIFVLASTILTFVVISGLYIWLYASYYRSEMIYFMSKPIAERIFSTIGDKSADQSNFLSKIPNEVLKNVNSIEHIYEIKYFGGKTDAAIIFIRRDDFKADTMFDCMYPDMVTCVYDYKTKIVHTTPGRPWLYLEL